MSSNSYCEIFGKSSFCKECISLMSKTLLYVVQEGILAQAKSCLLAQTGKVLGITSYNMGINGPVNAHLISGPTISTKHKHKTCLKMAEQT